MTLRTSSATRRSVVSRSSVVLTTSATSSRRGSTSERRPVGEAVVFTGFIISGGRSGSSHAHLQFVIGNLRIEDSRFHNYQLQIFQHADIRKVAVFFRVVQAIADDVSIGNGEADVVRLDRLPAARSLVQQGGNAQRPGLMRLDQF